MKQPGDTSVQAVRRACQLLRAFANEDEVLRLRDLSARTSIHKATASRLMQTLVAEGMVERLGDARFRCRIKSPARQRRRIGFATRGVDTSFSRAVSQSVQRAAEEHGMELITVSNHRSPSAAVRNAEALVREGVELVLEFQSHERVAPVVASRFLEAGIPVIAMEIPHPGATFFGANNFQAGMLGGRAMGAWVKEHWQARAAAILVMVEEAAGPLVKLRTDGMLAGLREALPESEHLLTSTLNGHGSLVKAMETVRRTLRLTPTRRTIVLAGNDPMALGVIRAFEEAGRSRHCAVMSQNASLEARMELRRKSSPLVASVAYFPERYGDEVLRLAALILAGKTTSPAVFTKHELITPQNVDKVYPLDHLLPEALAAAVFA